MLPGGQPRFNKAYLPCVSESKLNTLLLLPPAYSSYGKIHTCALLRFLLLYKQQKRKFSTVQATLNNNVLKYGGSCDAEEEIRYEWRLVQEVIQNDLTSNTLRT